MVKIHRKTWIFIVLMLGFLLMIYLNRHAISINHDQTHYYATLLPEPRPIENLQLVDDHNQKFSENQFKGQWTLLFFGYSRCRQACPLALKILAETYHALLKAGVKNLPQVMMVTLDPIHDTTKELHRYVTSFHPSFVGLTGKVEDVYYFAKQVGVAHSHDKKGRAIDIEHTSNIVIIDPHGRWYGIYTSPYQSSHLVQDFMKLQNQMDLANQHTTDQPRV